MTSNLITIILLFIMVFTAFRYFRPSIDITSYGNKQFRILLWYYNAENNRRYKVLWDNRKK